MTIENKENAFNIELTKLSPNSLALLKKTTSSDNFEGNTQNFHKEGLFSIETFGRLGSEARFKNFSYIDIKIDIIHPFLFELLGKVKGLYTSILMGKSWVKWDSTINDFVQSDELNGETGYDFFMRYWKDLDFKITGEKIRDHRIMV
jgi:hypothetical protein